MVLNAPDLWQHAYAKIYANPGNMTAGVDGLTIDGYSEERAANLRELLRENRYGPTPVRRVYIPKPNGKQRPLGIPGPHDKQVQEVWRMILEAIYEPVFKDRAHGFRPKRSCHTALKDIKHTWTGVKWFIEFDIEGYFDRTPSYPCQQPTGRPPDGSRGHRPHPSALRAPLCAALDPPAPPQRGLYLRGLPQHDGAASAPRGH